MGFLWYLSAEETEALFGRIGSLWAEGSELCFDYSVSADGESDIRRRALAGAAGESMKAVYSYSGMEALLGRCGFLIYEELDRIEAERELSEVYNRANPMHPMHAPKGVRYCLAVKKRV